MIWHIRDRILPIGERTLIMGILNVTPDSFSDGGQFITVDTALSHAEQMIAEGADIIDVGGESTRPGGEPVSAQDEIERVVPVIEVLARRTDTPISVDTTKSEVARAALDAGAAIVNDISALRFDFYIADAVARAGAGLVLMHSRGTPATRHRLPPVADIMHEVTHSLRASINMAERRGVKRESIVIDPGIGFGKSLEQNLELIAKVDQLIAAQILHRPHPCRRIGHSRSRRTSPVRQPRHHHRRHPPRRPHRPRSRREGNNGNNPRC
jgi:dihydropteroate synthase